MGDVMGGGDNDDYNDNDWEGGGQEEGTGIGHAGGPGGDGPAIDVRGRDRGVDKDWCMV